tara:strand:- start:86 stop:1489 length:1404 start_codon:yes stop_codon:yes gene_type:complete
MAYSAYDMAHPAGSNSLTAKAKFFQRSLYESTSYPRTLTDPMDTWYSKNLFGRIDRKQFTIIPRDEGLAQVLHAQNPNVYCLNFVNDAFDHFVRHMQAAAITNCLEPGNEAIRNPIAVFAWTSPVAKWNAYKEGIIAAFIKAFRENPEKPVKNYNDFKPIFIAYLKQIAKMTALTKTSFFLTNHVNPYIGGLSIGISDDNCGDDSVKYEEWISDPNFRFYVQSAKKYGLRVNKNMPWILTADLFTGAIQKFLSAYEFSPSEGSMSAPPSSAEPPFSIYADAAGLTPSNFFHAYYTRVYKSDLDDLNNFILDAYAKLVAKYDTYGEEKTLYQPHCNNVFNRQNYLREPLYLHRPPLPAKDIIDLYVDIRYFEARSPDDISLRVVRRRAYDVYRQRLGTGVTRAAALDAPRDYINGVFKAYIYPVNYQRINPHYYLDTTDTGDIIDTAGEISFATSTTTTNIQNGPTSY